MKGFNRLKCTVLCIPNTCRLCYGLAGLVRSLKKLKVFRPTSPNLTWYKYEPPNLITTTMRKSLTPTMNNWNIVIVGVHPQFLTPADTSTGRRL
jgi:hypothetical protein